MDSKDIDGVICLVDNINYDDSKDLLNKGKQFKLTPTNMTKVKQEVEVGLNRLYCGLRYANPGWVEKEKNKNLESNEVVGENNPDSSRQVQGNVDNDREGENSAVNTEEESPTVRLEGSNNNNNSEIENQNVENDKNKVYNHPMRSITSKFDKDIKAPYRATKEIEAKIKIIKSQLSQPVYNIKNIKIKQNFKKSEIESIKKIKEHNEAAIHFTDKTNKIAIVNKSLVEEKTLDHLRSNKFRELNYDPSSEIEKKGKNF